MSNTKTSIAHWETIMLKCATITYNYEELDVVFNSSDIISIMNTNTGEYYSVGALSNDEHKQLTKRLNESQTNNVV